MRLRVKQWVLRTFFSKELDALFESAKMEGSKDAFSKAHQDLRDTMKDDVEERAEVLATEKLAALLMTFDPQRIVTFNERTSSVFIGGEKADEVRLRNLKQEAEAMEQFDLWHILYETPKALAEKAMFVSGESVDDLKKGRSILYVLATQKRILDTFKSYAQVKK